MNKNSMNRRDLHTRFGTMIQNRKEQMVQASKKRDDGAALLLYGEIAGIAAAMRTMNLIDYDQMEDIKHEAWDIYQKKEPAFEGC